ncbi:hypothetical protein [Amycolatopsis sp. NPDC051903]|uniref:hypothetical protein n=1 Tax=Amycolatopsis sp. NPDC051903 TaxID=3363936 RepID=UPI0037A8E2CA
MAEAEVRNGQRRPDWEGLLDVAEELRQVRWLLGNIAGNLNDVARVANSTGEIGEEAGTVLGLVRRIAGRADASLGELKEQTR